MDSKAHIALTEEFSAHNYSPLGVVIARANGAHVWDVEGNRYLDMLSAYSALNFGHCNPRLTRVAHEQLDLVTLTSRAFFNDQLGPLCRDLASLCKLDMVLPMTSGAEAVETSIKAARRWGYQVKGVAVDKAEIITFSGNFAGRTTTIISFTDSDESRHNFGPFTPGFKLARFGDLDDTKDAVTEHTVAILVEPIQGEGGIIIPPDGFIRGLRELCDRENILLIADEIQTGLCRTGKVFGVDHDDVLPDLMTIGKSLGGGITPLSALIGKRAVMQLFTPGSHGSTFGGNTFACRIAREVIALINQEKPQDRSAELGNFALDFLRANPSKHVNAIRGRGLFIGIDIKPESGSAKDFCYRLKDKGILCKDTRKQTIRLAPPLIIERSDLEAALETIVAVLA